MDRPAVKDSAGNSLIQFLKGSQLVIERWRCGLGSQTKIQGSKLSRLRRIPCVIVADLVGCRWVEATPPPKRSGKWLCRPPSRLSHCGDALHSQFTRSSSLWPFRPKFGSIGGQRLHSVAGNDEHLFFTLRSAPWNSRPLRGGWNLRLKTHTVRPLQIASS